MCQRKTNIPVIFVNKYFLLFADTPKAPCMDRPLRISRTSLDTSVMLPHSGFPLQIKQLFCSMLGKVSLAQDVSKSMGTSCKSRPDPKCAELGTPITLFLRPLSRVSADLLFAFSIVLFILEK